MDGFIYLNKASFCPSMHEHRVGNNLQSIVVYKIGKTRLKGYERLKSFFRVKPDCHQILKALVNNYHLVEHYLHKHFENKKIINLYNRDLIDLPNPTEWFELNEIDLNFIENHINELSKIYTPSQQTVLNTRHAQLEEPVPTEELTSILTSKREINIQEFDTQEKCIKYLEEIRWDNRPVCVYCDSGNRMSSRIGTNIHHCNKCNRDTTVLLRSPMEHSRLPLVKWFHIAHLLLYTNKTARQISRELQTPYQHTWHAMMRLRCFMVPLNTGGGIKLKLRDDLKRFIKERSRSENKSIRIEGYCKFDKTLKELLSSYEGDKTNYQSVLNYLTFQMKAQYDGETPKYVTHYVAEFVYKYNYGNREDLFNYFMENAFL